MKSCSKLLSNESLQCLLWANQDCVTAGCVKVEPTGLQVMLHLCLPLSSLTCCTEDILSNCRLRSPTSSGDSLELVSLPVREKSRILMRKQAFALDKDLRAFAFLPSLNLQTH